MQNSASFLTLKDCMIKTWSLTQQNYILLCNFILSQYATEANNRSLKCTYILLPAVSVIDKRNRKLWAVSLNGIITTCFMYLLTF